MPMPLVPVKKRVPWTPYEHMLFLHGLQKYGKGEWKRIANECVLSKTPTQVASHAQKYYLQQARKEEDKKRNSIHDLTLDKLGQCMVPHHVNQLPIPQTNLGLQPQNHIHPRDVEIQQELQQPQQMLHSDPTSNLPQQMGDYEIHDINPQSTDNYTLLDIIDLCPKKKRNHPIDNVVLQQPQHMLHSDPTNNLPQQMGDYEIHDINPQSTDKYTLSDIIDLCPKKKRSHSLDNVVLQQPQQMLHSDPTNNLSQQMDGYGILYDIDHHNYLPHPLNCDLPPQDLTHPLDVTKQQQLHELQLALKRYLHYAYPQENLQNSQNIRNSMNFRNNNK